MNLCAKCGSCSTVCPVYRVSGQESDTARGKLHLLDKLAGTPHSAAYREIFSRCLLCGACRHSCPRALDLPGLVAAARSDFPRLTGSGSFKKLLTTSCLAHPSLLSGLADFLKLSRPLLRNLPEDSGLRLKLGFFLERPSRSETNATSPPHPATDPLPPKSGRTALFSGCLARYLRPEIARVVTDLLSEDTDGTLHIPTDQTCCGLAHHSAGDLDEARRLARRNLDAFAGTGPIVTPCGSCYSHLQQYPTLLADDPDYLPRAQAFVQRLREFSDFFSSTRTGGNKSIRSRGGENLRIFYHDPCHLRFQSGLREAPRQLLRALPGVELLELPDGPLCCGLGGTFNLAHPDLSHRIGVKLAEAITTLAPDLVLTSCSGCLIQLHRELGGAGTIPVVHLGQFLADRCVTPPEAINQASIARVPGKR